MFLKLFKLDKPTAAPPSEAAKAAASDSALTDAEVAVPVPIAANDAEAAVAAEAEAAKVSAPARESRTAFATTDDLTPLTGPLGQEAALKALKLGAGIKGPGFHVLALGAPGAQISAAARHVLAPLANAAEPAPDWVYVHDFAHPHRRRALRLPAGRAAAFADGLAQIVTELRTALPQAFAAEDYRLRRSAIEQEARFQHEQRFDAFTRTAEAQNIAVLRTPAGFALAPMHDGKVVKPDVFSRLPERMRQDVEGRVTALQAELAELLASAPGIDRDIRKRCAVLDEETAGYVAEPIIAELADKFADMPELARHLDALAADVVRNAALFAQAGSGADPAELMRYLAATPTSAGKRSAGAPIVVESEATADRLFGEAVPCADAPAGVSVKAGALEAANGGFLILDGRGLLASPEIWPLMKRALSTGELAPIVRAPSGAAHVELEPIPLKVKVVLLADAPMQARLSELDPEFNGLFGITARFETSIPRDEAGETAFARAVAGIVREHDLLALDAAAVDSIVAHCTLAGEAPRLLIDHAALVELMREADYWARERGASVIGADDIAATLAERTARGCGPGSSGGGSAGS